MEVKPIKVVDIYLDKENPRHNPISDQGEIIEYLLKNEKIRPLARDIAKRGLSPLDLLAVTRDKDGNLIIVEGNRRLCSLLLLNVPEKAPQNAVSYFKKLAKNSNLVPSKVNAVEFPTKKEALQWMSLRHDGEQEGIGTKSWNTEQKGRFNQMLGRRDDNALATSLLDYAIYKGFIRESDKIKKITTATRYLGNPFLRNTLGISTKRTEKDVQITLSCIDFDKVLQRFCNDLINNVISSRSDKKAWERYARTLISENIAPQNHINPHPLEECRLTSAGESSNESANTDNNPNSNSPETEDDSPQEGSNTNPGSGGGGPGSGGSKDPNKRKYIIPHDFQERINNPILLRIFKELKGVEIDEYTLSVALCTRVFLENLYQLFLEKLLGTCPKSQTHKLILKIVSEVEQERTLSSSEQKAFQSLKQLASDDRKTLSPKSLGANAHAQNYPDARQLKIDFDNIKAAVSYMLKRI